MVLAYGLPARIDWSRLEKRSRALRGRNLTRDIQAPVRQWRVRPLKAFVTRGRFLESHWTPDLWPKKIPRRSRLWRNSLRLRTLQSDEPFLFTQ
jgi:hypothetical protein